MAAVETARSRALNKIAVALVILATIVYLIPLYWIGSTAFKPRAAATTVPPTVFFQPEVTGFVKLFTKRVQLRKAVPEETYNAAKWYEKLVYDAGERIITSSPFLSRFWNSIIIAARGGGHPDFFNVPHHRAGGFSYRIDSAVHGVQPVILRLADERVHG